MLREDSLARPDPALLAEAAADLSADALRQIWAGAQSREDLAEAMLDLAAGALSEDEALAFAGGLTITIASEAPWAVQRALPDLNRRTCRMVRTL
ncbi:hypothetical protein RZS08_59275, partial [Arthrospira platensis SPKY1]|nr:hypothetical protein [Arthrospira platensis SPKY1]